MDTSTSLLTCVRGFPGIDADPMFHLVSK